MKEWFPARAGQLQLAVVRAEEQGSVAALYGGDDLSQGLQLALVAVSPFPGPQAKSDQE
ncbi:hypothetical protein GCM10010387_36610 [Streptomyces inusitatus]|uniref:Uncharacterized protein n=1 Tax=Streptomyces inusitatus TaxID=68221 RepID=A0A918Q9R2_9ACTN|nr:hypothetical protein GCM10010387_36610 [Streptomyces inusitatus]